MEERKGNYIKPLNDFLPSLVQDANREKSLTSDHLISLDVAETGKGVRYF